MDVAGAGSHGPVVRPFSFRQFTERWKEGYMGRLDGKVAIITGAASGQGAAEAKLFAAEGAKVVVADLNAEGAAAVAATIGETALPFSLDVAEGASWSALVEKTLATFGKIDILINNAGVYRPLSFQETDAALMDFHFRVNVLGVFLGMKAVEGAMLANGGGAIVNTASGAGARGYPGMFAYAGSKWAVRGMSKCAAIDLASSNIRVNVLLPGLIDTPMLGSNDPDYLAQISKWPPAQRLGTVQEIAEAALYLASDAASYTMGADLAICGGLMA
ncbi:SDR family NAD(P)-dependent oxidoreductase [Sphingobium sp. EM0848]|uniref:SDR family NAD(P)-dependent oxidoreductase n=1 Tax=Sphingobium sp. EM0848 TaxID=2743473 RepID=UPI001C3F576B|nr:SDR family oxidoreductase [Sphingobium sp. EM0848]